MHHATWIKGNSARKERAARPVFRAALSLLILLSISVGGFAHGYAGLRPASSTLGLTEVVICSNGEIRTVFLDASGAPVVPSNCLHELCDACLANVSYAPDPTGADMPSSLNALLADLSHLPAPAQRKISDARPRAPPLS